MIDLDSKIYDSVPFCSNTTENGLLANGLLALNILSD